jgi:penicillin amidase
VRRLFRAIGLAMFALLAVATIAALFALRGSLAQLDGTVTEDVLTAPVRVDRDERGTATFHAENRRDLEFALGYVHAQERFFEMDLMRRSAAGELAELFGDAAVPLDRKARMHRMRARSVQVLEQLDATERAELDHYRDGVNAGLAALGVRPFPYLLTGTAPAPWRLEDTLLVVHAMSFTLNDEENARELAFSRMHAALPEAAYRFLTASGGSWDAPLAGTALAWPAMPSAQEFDLRRVVGTAVARGGGPASRTTPGQHEYLPGSNSFAVSGAPAGAALVANDMHLDLRVPGIWFRARFVYPDPQRPGEMIDVNGATLPGAPAMVVGSNRHIAWGFTNSYVDTTDWVRVIRDPDDPSRYRTAQGWEPLVHHVETIRVNGAEGVVLDIEETRWGPILASDIDGTPLALAWAAQQPGAVNLELVDLERARDVDAALTIAHRAGMPAQNFLVGDTQGRIAWTIAGKLPRRMGDFDPHLPADWSDGSGWAGWLPGADMPVIVDPPGGRLWTANQRIVDGDALALLGDGGYDLGARAGQIRDDLAALDRRSPAGLLAIQLDDRALFLARWRDAFEQLLGRMPASGLRDELSAAMAADRARANGPEFRASTDSLAYRIVRTWRAEVIDSVLDGFAAAVRRKFPDFTMPRLAQAEHAVWQLLRMKPGHLLPPGYADWDALLAACASRVGERLDAQPGGITARTWGERNTARIRHPLSRALPDLFSLWLDMPADELPGDNHMPRVQGPDFGASERFAVAPGDEQHGYFELAGGQSGHPLSPFHGAGHADWVAGRPTPFLPGPTVYRLVLEPEGHRD